jgi:hypothetical protein
MQRALVEEVAMSGVVQGHVVHQGRRSWVASALLVVDDIRDSQFSSKYRRSVVDVLANTSCQRTRY